MQEIQAYLSRELPRINEYLARQTMGLDPLVQPVAGHVLDAGGKRLRPFLTILTARALGSGEADVYPLACSLEFLHTATLLHDDILDGSELRRGRPAAHTVFDATQTILSGDVLLALANRLVSDYGIPRLVSCLSEAIIRTATGEIVEMANIRNPELSVEKYLEIITGKTAYLIQAACQAGAILARAEPDLEDAAARFGLSLGIAFQVVDDAMDYSSPADVSGKPRGADIREGKLTMPLILYIQEMDESGRLDFLARMSNAELGEEEILEVIDAVNLGGHTEQTRRVAADYVAEAAQALEHFPECLERVVLAQSLDYTVSRKK
jgi:octaprenyl-diphosphate synthase